ncbi:hypothetical protein F5882DRAFT_385935 [Hyaloscypha sp. PMI_1271]|nr:hypothetical protein F5882DRAFT_385935 [Hyaloscypha sp. PMI_1271]
MERLRYHIRATLEFCNGMNPLYSLGLTVIADREKLGGVNASVVHEHFKSWVETAPQREQGTARTNIQSGIQIWESQSALYCIQIDAGVMESIVYKAEAPPSNDARRAGFVKIVSRYWEPYGTRDRDPPQEPIQGCTEDDVG